MSHIGNLYEYNLKATTYSYSHIHNHILDYSKFRASIMGFSTVLMGGGQKWCENARDNGVKCFFHVPTGKVIIYFPSKYY